MPLKIAIVGGGPVGLTLARILLTAPSNIDVTIFESDASASSRTTRGGTLDLRPGTGLAAIDAAGLRPGFDLVARSDPESSGIILADRQGKIVFEKPVNADEPNTSPEIDRIDLRTLLLDGLPDTAVRWGARLASIAPDGTMSFANGAPDVDTSQFDLIVGAEGAWSKVRAHIAPSTPGPRYSGIGVLEMYVSAEDAERVGLARVVKGGLYLSMGSRQVLTGQRVKSGAYMFYAGIPTESVEEFKAFWKSCGGDQARVRDRFRALYEAKGWAPELLAWFDVARLGDMRAWPLYEYELPDGHVWEHKKGWTLVGDAAHVMTPFAGEGVNAGMRDALELAKRLRALGDGDGEALDAAVKEYEEEMFARLRPLMLESLTNKASYYHEKAPDSVLEKLRAALSKYEVAQVV
ncbi:hypothetical protein H0H81_009288 [Sphagnurus paluster]|uniref:FAD-binding domain-containing protein n=1 Tax=Sphagnurus paluster TaxID=117069 RepID=A0A9P7GPR5_9AGAR|nr:hypothetical protein H0H81_009288 [Sphagnurus paluster]